MTIKLVELKKLHTADEAALGYSIAAAGDSITAYAAELLRRYPTGEFPDETRERIESGMKGRKAELFGTVYYVRDGNTFVQTDDDKAANFAMSVDVATSYSTYDFGKLEPALKAIVKPVRDATNKYVSNSFAALNRAIKALMAGETSRTRATLAFGESAEKAIAGLWASCRNKAKKGDPTAPTTKAEFVAMITDVAKKTK